MGAWSEVVCSDLYCWSPNFVLVDRDWLADRLSPPIRCAPGTDLVLLIAYMCPCSLEINISSASFLHFWRGDSRRSQDLAWAACSVPRNADQAATNSEFCPMHGQSCWQIWRASQPLRRRTVRFRASATHTPPCGGACGGVRSASWSP